jgi:hypothetical protein
MALKDIKLPTETVTFSGGSFELRGLSTEDVSALIQVHMSDLEEIAINLMTMDQNKASDEDFIRGLIVSIAQETPELIASLITLSAGEPDAEAMTIARKLPVSVQLEACLKIYKLTVEDFAAIKKLIAANLSPEIKETMKAKLPKTTKKNPT